MFKKKAFVLFLTLVLVMSLTVAVSGFGWFGRGGDDDDDGTIEITISTGAVGQELELAEAAAEKYMEQNPDVEITVMDTPDSADERQGLYLQFLEAQSSEVDIMQIDVIWPGDMAVHFLDLNQYGAEELTDGMIPALVENNTVNGELVALPWFLDSGMLYYREDLLEEYGYDVPETWDELEEAALAIKEGERAKGNADFEGFIWQGDAYEGLTCNALEWLVSHGAGSIVSPQGEITINNPRAVEALERARGWIEDGVSPRAVTGYMEEEGRAVWQGGNAVFHRNWPYVMPLAQDDPNVAGKFGIAPLPSTENGDPAHTLGGWQLAVSRYSEHPEVAADVAMFLAGEEQQRIRGKAGFNPTIAALYRDAEMLEVNPYYEDFYDIAINATARPSTASAPYYADVSRAFYTGVYDVLQGDMDAQTAVEYMELDIQDITGLPIR